MHVLATVIQVWLVSSVCFYQITEHNTVHVLPTQMPNIMTPALIISCCDVPLK